MSAMDAKYDYEYLIKFKNMSYMRLQWLSGAEIGEYSVTAWGQEHYLCYAASCISHMRIYFCFNLRQRR